MFPFFINIEQAIYKYILPVICNYRKYILYCLRQKLYALNAHNSAHCTVYAQLYFFCFFYTRVNLARKEEKVWGGSLIDVGNEGGRFVRKSSRFQTAILIPYIFQNKGIFLLYLICQIYSTYFLFLYRFIFYFFEINQIIIPYAHYLKVFFCRFKER